MTQSSVLSKKYWRCLLAGIANVVVIVGLVALVATLPVPSAKAQGIMFLNVFPPNMVAYGRTYSEWSAAWEQWADSIPVAQHPLFDNNPPGDCSAGQSGPVWFLGGKFCPNSGTCSYTGVVRSCSVPFGKALYFPVLNSEDSALEESIAEHPGQQTYQQIATLRSQVAGWMDSATSVSCTVDGAPIPNLMANHRVQSAAFGFTFPTDNIFKSIYGSGAFTAGTYYPAVDDGWYVMLAPLPPGPHVVHISSGLPGFALDVTYHLNVHR